MSVLKELNIPKEINNNTQANNNNNNINNNKPFEKQIEEKLLERFDRYYHDIKKMRKLIKKGFKSDEDFKNLYELYCQIEYKKDYQNVIASMDNYKTLRKFITYSFK